jgi:hypothetical protein
VPDLPPPGRHRQVAGHLPRDPVAQFRDAVVDVDQIDSAEYATAGFLLGRQGVVPVGEPVEAVVAPLGDRGHEVGAGRPLEGQDHRGMTGMQAPQLGHCPTLSR